jgi:ABC-type branched-subunit amino acid transport system substrate-binding protein
MRTRIVAAACVLALLASGCGSRLEQDDLAQGDGLGDAGTTVAPGGGDPGSGVPMFGTMEAPCGPAPDGFAPTASDEGVTADKIRIGVVSDRAGQVKVPTASIEESMKAFVNYCNDLGGINGRQLELETFDSALFATREAVVEACNAGLFALVGTGSVFDSDGAEASVDCGLPDIAGYTATARKTLAPNVITPVPNPPENNAVGPARYIAEQYPDAVEHAAVVSSSQVEAAWNQAMRIRESWTTVGFDFQLVADTQLFQETYSAEAQRMKAAGIRFVTMVSETSETAKLLRDMRAQSFQPDVVSLGAQYYDPALLTEPASEGVYIELNTVPFEEADLVPAMRQFLDAYDTVGSSIKPTALGVQSFSAGLLFAEAAKNAGADLTRESLVAEMRKINSWDGGGLHFETNPGDEVRSACMLLMQIRDGAFTRVHPAEPGTFACEDNYIAPISDPEYNGDNDQW